MSSGLVLDVVDDAARLVAVASARFMTANGACQWLVLPNYELGGQTRPTPSPGAPKPCRPFRLVFADAG